METRDYSKNKRSIYGFRINCDEAEGNPTTTLADCTLFAAFLATTMAISAMPVIAKILMDLDLMRRNIGLVILSAGS